jgi:predicted outer membrane protein
VDRRPARGGISVILRIASPMAAILIGLAVSGPGGAATLTDTDKAFIDAVAASDVAQVEMSRVALERLQTPAINSLAQTITSDHNENYQALLDLCREKQYAVAPQLDAYHGELLRKMKSAPSTEDVERLYVEAVNADQSALNGLLEQTAGNSNDTEVARFASDMLATVKSHSAVGQQLATGQQ